MQAGIYPNFFSACNSITAAAGIRGLFTGYLPTLLEDMPDMAFKFAAYESMRSLRLRLMKGRKATAQVPLRNPALLCRFVNPLLCDGARLEKGLIRAVIACF